MRVTETEIVKYLHGSDVLVLMKRFTYEIAQDMLSKRLFSYMMKSYKNLK